MSTPGDGNGEVRITLKDLYLAQQRYEGKLVDSDRKLTEALADLKITLVSLQSHLSGLDQRNAAADELHREHGRRLTEVERVIDTTGLRTMREERSVIVQMFEGRIKKLEDESISAQALDFANKDAKSAESLARQARSLAKQSFWGMIAAIIAAIGLAVALLAHVNVH